VIAVDTNVIVRLLTGDDPQQSEQARLLFDRETVFLPKTVLLEAERVLRRLYRLERARVINALTALVALPGVRCEDEPAIIQALAWSQDGLDFADAVHVASSRTASRFATFDQGLIKQAASTASGVSVSQP
jgi:predicted nucleic-acid-binding protein